MQKKVLRGGVNKVHIWYLGWHVESELMPRIPRQYGGKGSLPVGNMGRMLRNTPYP